MKGIVESVEYLDTKIKSVYDIEVEGNHNFFAENILVHNCHFLPAQTLFDIACKAKNSYYRIGVSATPWRDGDDDILIESALNIRKPHLSINASKLIKKGQLTSCEINFINFDSNTDWQGDYNSTYLKAIVHNERRNSLIVDLALQSVKDSRTVLILINNIEHGQAILNQLKTVQEFEEVLYPMKNDWLSISEVEFISGSDDLARREAVFQSVQNGFTKILIGSTIADEGLDLPRLDCLILAGSGKSSTRAFQRIGRILRLYPGKKNAIVYDFMDSNPTFNRQARIREALYKTESEWKINYI